jgi:hypothetical protein
MRPTFEGCILLSAMDHKYMILLDFSGLKRAVNTQRVANKPRYLISVVLHGQTGEKLCSTFISLFSYFQSAKINETIAAISREQGNTCLQTEHTPDSWNPSTAWRDPRMRRLHFHCSQ